MVWKLIRSSVSSGRKQQILFVTKMQPKMPEVTNLKLFTNLVYLAELAHSGSAEAIALFCVGLRCVGNFTLKVIIISPLDDGDFCRGIPSPLITCRLVGVTISGIVILSFLSSNV